MTDGVQDTGATGGKLRSAADQVREKAEAARTAASAAYAGARARAIGAKQKTAEGIDGNPVAVVIGGLALGAVIGALLPRTERETKTLGSVGGKINKAAKDAISAAKEAGQQTLDEMGVSKNAAKSQMQKLLDTAGKAAASASGAAVGAIKKS